MRAQAPLRLVTPAGTPNKGKPSEGKPAAKAPTAHLPLPNLAEADAWICKAFDKALAQRALLAITVSAPLAPLDTPLRCLRKGPAILWRSPDGDAEAGHGTAVSITLAGSERFSQLETESDAIFGRLLPLTQDGVPLRPLRLYGGWAFTEGSAQDAPWDDFGPGRFILPRWLYRHEQGSDGPSSATLTLVVDLRDGWAGRRSLLRSELATIFEALARKRPGSEHPTPVTKLSELDRASWEEQVQNIGAGLSQGLFRKVVTARRSEVQTALHIEPWDVLRRLGTRYPETWRFGIRLGNSTFVGATPERLFRKRGNLIESDALAGSIGATVPDAEAKLLGSHKDRREHAPVVSHLVERLSPLCSQLDPHGDPSLRRLPNVLHLHTPISGTLHPNVHPAELAAALHPTPAVGGVPGDVATRWIEANEQNPRGWYCGPVGWIDSAGDAELTVALRCGVIRGCSAWLYAGGGIVEGSTPDAEWEESSLKMRPLLRALGVHS